MSYVARIPEHKSDFNPHVSSTIHRVKTLPNGARARRSMGSPFNLTGGATMTRLRAKQQSNSPSFDLISTEIPGKPGRVVNAALEGPLESVAINPPSDMASSILVGGGTSTLSDFKTSDFMTSDFMTSDFMTSALTTSDLTTSDFMTSDLTSGLMSTEIPGRAPRTGLQGASDPINEAILDGSHLQGGGDSQVQIDTDGSDNYRSMQKKVLRVLDKNDISLPDGMDAATVLEVIYTLKEDGNSDISFTDPDVILRVVDVLWNNNDAENPVNASFEFLKNSPPSKISRNRLNQLRRLGPAPRREISIDPRVQQRTDRGFALDDEYIQKQIQVLRIVDDNNISLPTGMKALTVVDVMENVEDLDLTSVRDVRRVVGVLQRLVNDGATDPYDEAVAILDGTLQGGSTYDGSLLSTEIPGQPPRSHLDGTLQGGSTYDGSLLSTEIPGRPPRTQGLQGGADNDSVMSSVHMLSTEVPGKPPRLDRLQGGAQWKSLDTSYPDATDLATTADLDTSYDFDGSSIDRVNSSLSTLSHLPEPSRKKKPCVIC